MKANELMIGDWVVVYGTSFGYLKVVKIDSFDGSVLLENDLVISESYGFLQPIPLTKDILKKNGFTNDFYKDEAIADYRHIRLEGYTYENKEESELITWCNGEVDVTTDHKGCVQKRMEYVHELQHALRMCNIDKEIIL